MKKTSKKTLSLSKATIKQLTETVGAAKICTFGSTAQEPSIFQATCFTCASQCPCTGNPCL
jgi:hypothetical protein